MSIVTAAEVRGWSDTEVDPVTIDLVIGAVEEHAASRYDLPDPAPASVKLGVLMQVSRYLRRRKTPDGVALFGTEVALRVNKFDPDIDAMLSPYEKAMLA